MGLKSRPGQRMVWLKSTHAKTLYIPGWLALQEDKKWPHQAHKVLLSLHDKSKVNFLFVVVVTLTCFSIPSEPFLTKAFK